MDTWVLEHWMSQQCAGAISSLAVDHSWNVLGVPSNTGEPSLRRRESVVKMITEVVALCGTGRPWGHTHTIPLQAVPGSYREGMGQGWVSPL